MSSAVQIFATAPSFAAGHELLADYLASLFVYNDDVSGARESAVIAAYNHLKEIEYAFRYFVCHVHSFLSRSSLGVLAASAS